MLSKKQKEKIMELRKNKVSFRNIMKEMGISKDVLSYFLYEKRREYLKRYNRNRKHKASQKSIDVSCLRFYMRKLKPEDYFELFSRLLDDGIINENDLNDFTDITNKVKEYE